MVAPVVPRSPGTLPSPLTSFLAREQEVADVCALLRRNDVRLLTLTGPGGVGKSRLALAAATQVAAHFPAGPTFVALAPVREAHLVAPTISQALGIGESSSRSVVASLIAAIGDGQTLLVLDNFEHVLDAAPLTVELLMACPALTIVTTSRAALHVSGEWEYPVSPLALPNPHAARLSDIAQVPAVRLFAERAMSVDPGFVLSSDNAAAVAAICMRLDGLPLAIELAAARSKMLAPPLLLPRLAHRLPLLTGGPRDVPARLQTMVNAIAWSYDLLPADTQRLFRTLAVFVGGFDLDAGYAVAVDPAPGEGDALTVIESLLEQNLVRREDAVAARPRFGMLETIREFGAEQLAKAGDEHQVRARHATYFLALAEEAEPQIVGPDQVAWLNRLEAELPNLRVAVDWLLSEQRIEDGLRLMGALGKFWHRRCHYTEIRNSMTTLLAAPASSVPTSVRASALVVMAELANMQGDYQPAVTHCHEALRLFRELGDSLGAARALCELGGTAVDAGEAAQAQAFLEEAVVLQRSGSDHLGLAWSHGYLGVAAYAQGDYASAARWFADGLALARAVEDVFVVGQMLGDAGHVALARGQLVPAATWYEEALSLHQRLGARWDVGWCLAGFAGLAAAMEQFGDAARLFGAASALYERSNAPMRPSVQQTYDRLFAPARAAVGAETWDTLFAAGTAMPMDDAIKQAHVIAAQIISTPSETPLIPPGTPRGHALTQREAEVLRLVAAGHSNGEIAAALFISVPTVKRHVSTILAKLELPSRPAAVAFAHTHGLT